MFKVLNDRVLTFQIKGAKRTKGNLYVSDKSKGFRDYLDIAPVWIAQIGPYCDLQDEVEPGQVALIQDHFELEEIPGVWHEYENDPRFSLLKKRAKEVDGDIVTSIMSESAFIAFIDLCEPEDAEHTISFGDGQLREFGVCNG